jgi:hypothetical protein
VSDLAAAAAATGIMLAVAAVTAFDLYCLARVRDEDRPRFLPAPARAMLIAGVSPAGGAAYLLCRRSPGPPARAPRPVPRQPSLVPAAERPGTSRTDVVLRAPARPRPSGPACPLASRVP